MEIDTLVEELRRRMDHCVRGNGNGDTMTRRSVQEFSAVLDKAGHQALAGGRRDTHITTLLVLILKFIAFLGAASGI